MSQKYIAQSSGRTEDNRSLNATSNFLDSAVTQSMVLAPSGRQPSAKSRAAAFRQKAKIYTNRNVGGTQIATTANSTKHTNKI